LYIGVETGQIVLMLAALALFSISRYIFGTLTLLSTIERVVLF
jgi:hypothetical protein